MGVGGLLNDFDQTAKTVADLKNLLKKADFLYNKTYADNLEIEVLEPMYPVYRRKVLIYGKSTVYEDVLMLDYYFITKRQTEEPNE